jgi:hypothetical protein
MSDEERERLDEGLVEAVDDMIVNHSTYRDTTEMETLLSRVEALREAPKWSLGKDFRSMSKTQSRKVESALKKAEKLHDELAGKLELIIGDGMLVFKKPVVCPRELDDVEPFSFGRIYLSELWDDEECEYEYFMMCDSGDCHPDCNLSPYDLPLATLLEVFNRIERSQARWFSEEEVAACNGCPEIVADPGKEASRAKTKTETDGEKG